MALWSASSSNSASNRKLKLIYDNYDDKHDDTKNYYCFYYAVDFDYDDDWRQIYLEN